MGLVSRGPSVVRVNTWRAGSTKDREVDYAATVGKARGRRRVESRLVDMGSAPVDEFTGWEPDLDDTVKEARRFQLAADMHYVTNLYLDGPRIVHFSIMLFLEDDGQVYQIARADTCHREVHVHALKKDGSDFNRRVLLPINSPEDVGSGWDLAVDAIIDECNEHSRRWRSGG